MKTKVFNFLKNTAIAFTILQLGDALVTTAEFGNVELVISTLFGGLFLTAIEKIVK